MSEATPDGTRSNLLGSVASDFHSFTNIKGRSLNKGPTSEVLQKCDRNISLNNNMKHQY